MNLAKTASRGEPQSPSSCSQSCASSTTSTLPATPRKFSSDEGPLSCRILEFLDQRQNSTPHYTEVKLSHGPSPNPTPDTPPFHPNQTDLFFDAHFRKAEQHPIPTKPQHVCFLITRSCNVNAIVYRTLLAPSCGSSVFAGSSQKHPFEPSATKYAQNNGGPLQVHWLEFVDKDGDPLRSPRDSPRVEMRGIARALAYGIKKQSAVAMPVEGRRRAGFFGWGMFAARKHPPPEEPGWRMFAGGPLMKLDGTPPTSNFGH